MAPSVNQSKCSKAPMQNSKINFKDQGTCAGKDSKRDALSRLGMGFRV